MESRWNPLLWGLVLLLALVVAVRGQCAFTETLKNGKVERSSLMEKLNDLPAEVRNTAYSANEKKYRYDFHLCPDKNSGAVGIEQMENKDGKWRRVAVIGRHNESDVHMSGRGDLVILTYTKGDNYTGACNKGERHAMIMLRCVPGLTEISFDMLEESVGDGEDFCFYTFEMLIPPNRLNNFFGNCSSPTQKTEKTENAEKTENNSGRNGPISASPTDGAHHALGAGPIILILVLVPLLAFFVIGSIYKRFVAGAQGWEQVPFIDFWRSCGSRNSNGWRHAFGRGRTTHGPAYDEYSAVSTDEERQPALGRNGNVHDDHLLPM